MSKKQNKYDIALSFAGEDRALVEEVANWASFFGLSVFYDDWEQANLIGEDLFLHLSRVYSKSAKLCLLFASKNYPKKMWTRHELKFAHSRAIQESGGYIIPVRIDDTEIPGIPVTTGYIDARKMRPSAIAALIAKRLGRDINPTRNNYALAKKHMEYEIFNNGSIRATGDIELIWTSSPSDHYVAEIWSPDGNPLHLTSFIASDAQGKLRTEIAGQSNSQIAFNVFFRDTLNYGDSINIRLFFRCKSYFSSLKKSCSDNFKIGVPIKDWQYNFKFPSGVDINYFYFDLFNTIKTIRSRYRTTLENGKKTFICHLNDPPVGSVIEVRFSGNK